MSVYDFSAKLITGEEQSLREYENQVMLIVNTATECGFTPQLEDLQRLYEIYRDNGFVVLGFPCNQFGGQEPGPNAEIAQKCRMDYGVEFPLFAKVDVKGDDAHPLFKYLTEEAKGILTEDIKWNFTKFLIDRKGQVIRRYAPMTKPERITEAIESIL